MKSIGTKRDWLSVGAALGIAGAVGLLVTGWVLLPLLFGGASTLGGQPDDINNHAVVCESFRQAAPYRGMIDPEVVAFGILREDLTPKRAWEVIEYARKNVCPQYR